MRTTFVILTSTLLVAGLAAQKWQPTTTAGADEWNPRKARGDARSYRRSHMDGDQVEQNVLKLRKELRWHKSITSALSDARSKGRPLVWIQALGELDGYL